MFFCKIGEDENNFMELAVVVQGTCCRNYVQFHSIVLEFGRTRMLLCVACAEVY